MKEFLKGQFDYIYFFYGFSLFLMALICFGLARKEKRGLPWMLLSLFASLNGLSVWLDMLMIMHGRDSVIAILNLSVLAISYLFLFEFARVGLLKLKGKRITRWIYFFLLAFFSLSYKFSLSGWLTAVHYFLAFPSTYFAARIIYDFSRRIKDGKGPLTALSAMLSLYAVFSGLVVPKTNFILASFINFESFYDAIGIPVQLISAILALCAALAIWLYSSTSSIVEYKLKRYPLYFIPSKWMIALILMVFIGAGWIFTSHLDYYAVIQTIKRSEAKADSQFNRLRKEITVLGKAAFSMSKSSAIRSGVSSWQRKVDTGEIEKILGRYKIKFGALNCALVDRQGLPIASVGDTGLGIKMGKSLAPRPYFREALLGGNGYHFQQGQAYNERIYYVSYPVKDVAGKISGVAVIAKSIHAEPLFQYRLFTISITFFICVIAIIFFTALRKREALIVFIEKVHAQLEEVDRMKTDFISTVSHELRTPLTSIRNAAAILMKGGPAKRLLDEHEKELLEIILDNTDRQTRMVSDLLDVSKIEAGVMPIFPKPIDIAGLINDTVASLRPLADNKKVNIVLALAVPGKMVYADPDHLRRILNNLVVNAITFTAEDGKVTISAEDAGTEARITVSDTGIGISAVDKENLFKKFYSPASAAAQEKKGCGLGLAITKGLVEAQKGKIWVDSEPQKGSSFCFTLPISQQDDKEKNPGSG